MNYCFTYNNATFGVEQTKIISLKHIRLLSVGAKSCTAHIVKSYNLQEAQEPNRGGLTHCLRIKNHPKIYIIVIQ